MANAVADGHITVVPEVLVTGGGGSVDGLAATLMRYFGNGVGTPGGRGSSGGNGGGGDGRPDEPERERSATTAAVAEMAAVSSVPDPDAPVPTRPA